jgi:(p)ppGpp synthase/HD superfamily hydrolase
MSKLEEAILLAVQAHAGQKDKAGAPYVLHPLRLMCRMDTDEERIAAVLHDVIEDTGHTLAELREAGYPEPVLAALDRLTKRGGETYDLFIERVIPDRIARKVKLADLEDNMTVTRVRQLTDKDRDRLNRYLKAWSRLKAIERES